jgi:hypothetical protein
LPALLQQVERVVDRTVTAREEAESDMRRREFILFLGGVVATWPLAAQQQAVPGSEFLSSTPRQEDTSQSSLDSARDYLKSDSSRAKNVAIDYRWAGGRFDRLPGWRLNSCVDR